MRKRITTVTTATAAAIVSAALLAGCGSKTSQAVNAVPKEVTTTQAETQISSAASTTQAQETAEVESTEAESTEAESTEETSEQVSEEVAVADNTPEPEYEAPAKEPVYEEPAYEAPEEEPDNSASEEPDNSVSEEPAYEEPAAEPEQPAESLPYLNEPMYTIISDSDNKLHVNVYTEDDLNHTEKHDGAGWQLVEQMRHILYDRGYDYVNSSGTFCSSMPRYADVDNGTREVTTITSEGRIRSIK